MRFDLHLEDRWIRELWEPSIAHHGPSSRLAVLIGKDRKGLASLLIYLAVIPLAFTWPKAAYGCYIFVAVMWLLPDRRIEKAAN